VQGAFNSSLILSQDAHKPSYLCIQFQPCKLLLIPGVRVLAHFFVLLLIVVHAFEVQKNHNNRSGGAWIPMDIGLNGNVCFTQPWGCNYSFFTHFSVETVKQ
jgi:hypothetical protein